MLDSVKSHIVVSNIIAEMSHLLSDRIVLKKVEIKSEQFPERNDRENGIQIYSADSDKSKSFDNKIKFKIVMGGLAADAAEIAEMINMLEMSDYFFQVIPGFSRNTIVGQRQACEFELTCYWSNYVMKQ